MVNKLATNNLLAPDMLLSHANNLPPSDITSVQKAGAHISSTPTSELHMGHGNPVCLNKASYSFSSLGIDCHSFCSSSIPAQMASALQYQRSARHASFEQKNEWARSNERTVEDVYNLGTILGARAIRLEDEIGSLRVGKKADVVIFRGDTPSMLVVAERDPVAAIVLHSSVRDVRTVIVDGVIRKSEGVLESVSTTDELGTVPEESCRTIDWGQVARAMAASRSRLDEQLSGVDLKAMQDGVMESFHLNRAQMRDE
jgi:cytosine/adenosine deaminase-related metal-dependent hydrolase